MLTALRRQGKVTRIMSDRIHNLVSDRGKMIFLLSCGLLNATAGLVGCTYLAVPGVTGIQPPLATITMVLRMMPNANSFAPGIWRLMRISNISATWDRTSIAICRTDCPGAKITRVAWIRNNPATITARIQPPRKETRPMLLKSRRINTAASMIRTTA